VAPSPPRPRCGLVEAPGTLTGYAITTAQLAESLASFAGRVVVDRTGLAQKFDLDLKWLPDQRSGPADSVSPTGPPDAPGLFTALKEQLGLRLEDGRGLVEVVAVESVSGLTPN
jgi:uncharacterized protein (TIGR03435 family)